MNFLRSTLARSLNVCEAHHGFDNFPAQSVTALPLTCKPKNLLVFSCLKCQNKKGRESSFWYGCKTTVT